MSERLRRLAKWVGYPLFALFAFLVFLYLSFPYDKLKSRIEAHVSAAGDLELTIGELGPRPLAGLVAERVAVTLRPKASAPGMEPAASPSGFTPPASAARGEGGAAPPAGEETPPPEKKQAKPSRILLEKVVVKVGLLAVIAGGIDVSFYVAGLGGEVQGSYEQHKKKGWSAKVELEKINLARLPFIAEAVGLPVGGSVSSKIELTVPLERWSEAVGQIDLECDGCSVGDGQAKLKVPGNPLLAMGVTLPQIRLGKLGGHIKIDKGVATLENLSAQSPDIEIGLEGTFMLRHPVAYSNAQAYLRFRISPELKRRDPKFELLENGLANAKRGDGFYGLSISGPLKQLRFMPSAVGPARDPGGGPGIHPQLRPGFRPLGAQGRRPAAAAGHRGG